MSARVVVSRECTWSDTVYTVCNFKGQNHRLFVLAVMSLDTLLEAAKYLESSSRLTSKDDSAIARGMI